jgi:glycosyltransferase involved in cell wall biosynthesis
VSNDVLWIAWEDDSSIRSRVLAAELGATLYLFTAFDRSRWLRLLRYPVAIVQTAWTLATSRPRVLVVQNPSILLAFQAAVMRPLLGYRLVIDLHTPFVRAPGIKKRVADALHNYGVRNCDVVLVSNEAYQRRVERETDRVVLVLPDRIPTLNGRHDRSVLRGARAVLYVCTFSLDEPWLEVLEAATLLRGDVTLYISGRAPLRADQVPPNVQLTGFLPPEEYQSLLRSVDAVMVLTTAEENLVCGGYEAVAAGRPLILSDTNALRGYFRRGTVFTHNTASAIAAAITEALERGDELAPEIEHLRSELTQSWNERWRDLLHVIEVRPTSGPAAHSPSARLG